MSDPIKFSVTVRSEVKRTARLSQVEGLFDVAPSLVSERTYDVSLALPEKWNVGVIVGPSMAGKSTVARELAKHFKTQLVGDRSAAPFEWPINKSLIDGFPAGMSVANEITPLLSSVGFSSPPDWRKPFHALSNGGQFRVTLARTLAEMKDRVAMVDEFSSVVDRTVAQIGSAAVAKTVRRRDQRFIAISCHYDVLDWLEPDWVYEPATNKLTLNAPAGEGAAAGQRPFGDGRKLSSGSFGRIRRRGFYSSRIII